ncbi:MAG: hypothetical protein ACREP7_09275 [Lysobacter sp.]
MDIKLSTAKSATRLSRWIAVALLACACAPAFAGNPMERVGVEHNAYLGCLVAQGDNGARKGSSLEDVVDLCGYKPEGSREEFIGKYASYMPTDRDLRFGERVAPYRKRFDSREAAFLDRIDRALSSDAQSAAEIDAELTKIENEAIAQLDAKRPGSQAVLAGLSTARHSLEFWNKRYDVEAPAGQVQTAKRKWWQVVLQIITVVGADVGCAVGVSAIPGGAAAAGPAAAACSEGVNELW